MEKIQRRGRGVLLSITEMWYTKKIRYRRSSLRVHIGDDGAGIVLE